MRKISLLFFLFLLNTYIFAQNKEQAGWLALSGNYKFSSHWGAYFDVQFRSSDEWKYLQQLVIRPGITYHFNKQQNAAFGYAYSETFRHSENNNIVESRIWEQFIQTHKIKKVFVTHRLRLEQRFIDNGTADLFSQRFRYSAKFILPFKKYEDSFKKGFYMAAQNELFLNVQNKENVNNSLFDRNRSYLFLGNRISKKLDIELAYLHQYVKGSKVNTINKVVQLGIITRF